jgi:hypothetical protein
MLAIFPIPGHILLRSRSVTTKAIVSSRRRPGRIVAGTVVPALQPFFFALRTQLFALCMQLLDVRRHVRIPAPLYTRRRDRGGAQSNTLRLPVTSVRHSGQGVPITRGAQSPHTQRCPHGTSASRSDVGSCFRQIQHSGPSSGCSCGRRASACVARSRSASRRASTRASASFSSSRSISAAGFSDGGLCRFSSSARIFASAVSIRRCSRSPRIFATPLCSGVAGRLGGGGVGLLRRGAGAAVGSGVLVNLFCFCLSNLSRASRVSLARLINNIQ